MNTQQLFIIGDSALQFWRWKQSFRMPFHTTNAQVMPEPSYVYDPTELDLLLNSVSHATCTSKEDLFTDSIHVMSENAAKRIRQPGICSHIRKYPVNSHTFCEIVPRVYVSTPSLCFAQVATKLPLYNALLLAMELCGTYSQNPRYKEPYSPYLANTYNRQPLCTIAELKQALSICGNSHGSRPKTLSNALSYIAENSASYMESVIELMLALPYKHGGYGLQPPKMNIALDSRGHLAADDSLDFFKPDIFWPEHMIALEYNSKEYHEEFYTYAHDANRREYLERIGIRVIPLTAKKVYKQNEFNSLAKKLAEYMGKRLRFPKDFKWKNTLLRKALLEEQASK